MFDPLPLLTAFVSQAEWSLARPLPVVTVEIRKAVGMAVLVPAGTLFLLYLCRRRPYVLASATSWLAASVMLLVLSVDTTGSSGLETPQLVVAGRLAMVTWALAALAFGASFRCAGSWIRTPPTVSPAFLWSAAAGVVWIGLAAVFLEPGTVVVPAFFLMCTWQVRGVIGFFRTARQYRFTGALIAGVGVAGIIVVNLAAAVIVLSHGDVSGSSINVSLLNFLSASMVILGMHLVIFEDVIEELRMSGIALRESRDQMRAVAVTDPLTNCYNRRFLDEVQLHELHQHRRYGLPLSLLYLDIDNFKAVNDTRGHIMGDRVLRTLANLLREQTRQSDYVLRWGGDEFLVLLSADEDNARAKAEHIRKAFLESAIIRGLPDGIDLTIGCAAVPRDAERLAPLIDQADRDMYRRRRP
jgi:diguanylate cyclase (GGDEF)-like protein